MLQREQVLVPVSAIRELLVARAAARVQEGLEVLVRLGLAVEIEVPVHAHVAHVAKGPESGRRFDTLLLFLSATRSRPPSGNCTRFSCTSSSSWEAETNGKKKYIYHIKKELGNKIEEGRKFSKKKKKDKCWALFKKPFFWWLKTSWDKMQQGKVSRAS